STRRWGLLPRALEGLDLERRHARFLRNEAVLLFNRGLGGFVPVQAPQQGRIDLAVGTLAAIDIEHVKHHEFAARGGFPGHGFILLCGSMAPRTLSVRRRPGCTNNSVCRN